MPTIQYTAQLDFTDNGTFETGWRIKQGDFGDCEIVFRVVNNGVNMYDALVTPEIVFRRADGASVISNMTPNDGTYKYTFVGNELAVPGLTLVDVKYTDSEGRISTASCRFTVVEDTIGYDPTGAHTYDNPVSELVEQATAASEVAIDSSFKAEGFAVGEQGGVPVEEGSPYYHNNAKYYGQELANSKADITSIGTDESGRTTASKAYAIGEHFYKDGKFCTAKTAIASGATFTLNTNYVEGDVASTIDNKITDQLTADSGGVISKQACITLGNIFISVYIITANAASSVVSGFPTLITQSNAPTALIRNLSNGQVVTANNYIASGKHTMTGLTSGTSYTVTIIGII